MHHDSGLPLLEISGLRSKSQHETMAYACGRCPLIDRLSLLWQESSVLNVSSISSYLQMMDGHTFPFKWFPIVLLSSIIMYMWGGYTYMYM